MWTKNDLVLILYNLCELETSTGRNMIFNRSRLGDRRTNLLAEIDYMHLSCKGECENKNDSSVKSSPKSENFQSWFEEEMILFEIENEDEQNQIKRVELIVADKYLPAVAQESDYAFRLQNFDIGPLESDVTLGVGHMQYREYLSNILEFI